MSIKSMINAIIDSDNETPSLDLHAHLKATMTNLIRPVKENEHDDSDEQWVTIETSDGSDADAYDIEKKLEKAGIKFSDIRTYRGSSEATFTIHGGNHDEDDIAAALNNDDDFEEPDPDDYDEGDQMPEPAYYDIVNIEYPEDEDEDEDEDDY